MYSAENYLWGWVAYSTGALCLLFCLWLLVRKIGIAAIRHSIMLLVTVIFFTPVTAYATTPILHPLSLLVSSKVYLRGETIWVFSAGWRLLWP